MNTESTRTMSDLSFELTGETREHGGTTLHRIRATRDIPSRDVWAGDLGGWVKSTHLADGKPRIADDAWVCEDAYVYGNARIYGNAHVCGSARVSGNAYVYGSAYVYGNAIVCEGAHVYGNSMVFGDARVCGDASVCEHAQVFGHARIFGDAWVYGDALVYGKVQVSGNAQVHGDAHICGDARVFSDAKVTQQSHVLTVGPIGSESVTTTLYRTTTGHALHVGCWPGTVGTLADEVERRSADWRGTATDHAAWRGQYDALAALCEATMQQWEEVNHG